MTIKSRLPKILEASETVILTLRSNSRIKHYGQHSLSDDATSYQQRIEYTGKDRIEDIEFCVYSCECHQVASVGMSQPDCKGNINGTVCYHSLACLMRAASDNKQTLSLFDHFSDASRYANFGGKLLKVVSVQGKGYCWAVTKEKESLKERVELLRGPVEEGID